MFGEILRFELRQRLRQPLLYLFAGCFFLMAFAATASDSVQVGGAIGNVARNAPFVICNLLGGMSAIGLIVLTLFVTTAINRDHELQTQELFFSTPLRKSAYLGGRFLGSLAPSVLAVMFSGLGVVLASAMPWQDPQYIVPFSARPYLAALFLFVLPNLFFAGALFFSVATLTRRVLTAWVTVVVFFTLWGVSRALLKDLDSSPLASLLDPFGLAPFALAARYWTAAERNTLIPALSGGLLQNRLLWTAIGFGILALTHARYRMTLADKGSATRSRQRTTSKAGSAVAAEAALGGAGDSGPDGATELPRAMGRFTGRDRWVQWLHFARREVGSTVRGIAFIVLMLMGVMNLTGVLVAEINGTNQYPVTRLMLRAINNGYQVFIFLVLVLYGGHLMWKERRARLHEVTDALPVPNWLPLTAKLTALCVVAVLAHAVAMSVTVVYQLARGYTLLEPGLYLKGLFLVSLSELALVAVLALVAHVLTNSMALGFLIMVLLDLAVESLPGLGLEHRLYLFSQAPVFVYSDMNGYGPYLPALFWFRVYWGFAALLLLLLGELFWVRGTDQRLRLRLRGAARLLTTDRSARRRQLAFTVALAGFLGVGGWIYYNTNIRNPYQPSRRVTELRALYETRYKHYELAAQPLLKAVTVMAEIHPRQPRLDLRGCLLAVNESGAPIPELVLFLDPEVTVNSFGLPPHAVTTDDAEIGCRVYALREPLAHGDTLRLDFDLTVAPRGFVNNDPNTRVVGNGTFCGNAQYMPRLGYSRDEELADPKDRKRFRLPPRERARPLHDPVGHGRPVFFVGDRVRYEATVGTDPDQVAVAPGRLVRTWEEAGRRYFHYVADFPMLNFFSLQSGRYTVARSHWQDVGIEIYHHPSHSFNVARIDEAVQRSLTYCTANFGPYPEKVVRIVEFPAYREFAQSFLTTIPYSEGAYFINDLRNPTNVDMVFFITAHEVAHQWWGHQVVPADVQGATMIEESLAQYSALMVMEKEFGRSGMKRFLAHQLDGYLRGRGTEKIGEQPLMLVENQPYIHYAKGGLALYALRDYIGEEALNKALRGFLTEHAYRGAPYPDSEQLVAGLRAATPDTFQYLIEDLFETITLFDNRTEVARVAPTADGRYRVTLKVQSRKYRADALGAEAEIPHEDWIEIGICGRAPTAPGEPEDYLFLEKRRLRAGENELEIVVDREPARAGIDPRHVLIDRVPRDNVKKVEG